MTTPEEIGQYLKTGLDLKEEGNALFKAGQVEKALAKYTKIFLWVNGLNPGANITGMMEDQSRVPKPTEDQQVQIKELRVTANLNCATCYLKMGKPDKALDFCGKALEQDADNKKAVWRRGQAYLAMNDVDNAQKDLEASKVAFPTDKGVAADLATLAKKFEEHKQKERNQFKGMFSKVSLAGSEKKAAASQPEPQPAAAAAAPAPQPQAQPKAAPASANPAPAAAAAKPAEEAPVAWR